MHKHPLRLPAPGMRYGSDFNSLEAEWFASNAVDYGEPHPIPVPVPPVEVVLSKKKTWLQFGWMTFRLLRLALFFGFLIAFAIGAGLAVVASCYEVQR